MGKLTEMQAQDAEANAFAMELLMPEQFIQVDLKRLGGIDLEDDVAVSRLAKKYRVTNAAMICRLSGRAALEGET